MPKPEKTPNITHTQTNNPLHGVTLAHMLTELEAHFGWQGLSSRIPVNCFSHEPSLQSSLKFLRRTPWARDKVETLYLQMTRQKNNR
ncbi:VF530 family protein [Methylophilus aquaticus]|uniref:VF530 family protein n=1 Tax=Methylophilus aquaticus TaxID=1971610 RepID=A0ABT9JS68_9PROT|nr:VF530 family protein [Methylophilus aquaticus]MDP8567403.1 VF530 family protein [Methylophilus aquaticus]